MFAFSKLATIMVVVVVVGGGGGAGPLLIKKVHFYVPLLFLLKQWLIFILQLITDKSFTLKLYTILSK